METINSDGWSNILTVILLIVTGAYVYLTWRIANANQLMLKRAEEQHLEQTRPTVYAYIEFREQVVVRLVIENMGNTPAYDLQVNLNKNFYQFGDRSGTNLRNLALFRSVTSWLPPGAKIPIDLAQGFNFDKEHDGEILTPSQFKVELSYRSKFASYKEICEIDLALYEGMHMVSTTAEQLGKIVDQMKKIAAK